jgi:hypothetical protein
VQVEVKDLVSEFWNELLSISPVGGAIAAAVRTYAFMEKKFPVGSDTS